MVYTEAELKAELNQIKKDNDFRISKSPMLMIAFDTPEQLAKFHEALVESDVWDGEITITKNVSHERYQEAFKKLAAGFPDELLPIRYEELSI